MSTYERPLLLPLLRRLREGRRHLQILAGPRQVGKTTLARQAIQKLGLPHVFAAADAAPSGGHSWIQSHWERARVLAGSSPRHAVLLVMDEVQKIPGWSESVKRFWDEDTAARRSVKVLLLGSSPLLIQQGLTESLAGRFETLRATQWSFHEMKAAFGWDLERFLRFGGYPGAAPLVEDPDDPDRWARYVLDSLIETTISRDILLLTRVDKPALLRRLFDLGCAYSGQAVSYTKMLGQLHEAGNTTTLAHYLDLLGGCGMLAGVPKYAGARVRQRASSPKLVALDTGLVTAVLGRRATDPLEPEARGHLVETAVGAHLLHGAAMGAYDVFTWRAGDKEVDYVLRRGDALTAIEVKSTARPAALPGFAAFESEFGPVKKLLVGSNGIPLEEFLQAPIEDWMASR